MSSLDWVNKDPSPPRLLAKSVLLACALEALLLTGIGWHEHWLAHPPKSTGLDESKFVEAEMFQFSEEAHLVEEKKPVSPPRREMTLSNTPSKGATSPSDSSAPPEENVTESGPKVAADHGPIAVYAPPPAIPSYLQNQEINAHVLIEFFVTYQGAITPRLVGSSGNEELDAIALEAVKKWQFRPAEKDHKAIDSKVRLRIVFEVK